MSAHGLAVQLRDATQSLHRAAERSAIMQDLLRGRVAPAAYCLMLRNLHPLYAALEAGLDRHAQTAAVAPVRFPEIFRAPALTRDLVFLHGDAWPRLPLAEATQAYCARLEQLTRELPCALAAHAYVRYLGDLSGGQMLRGVVIRALALGDARGTAFYDFGAAAGPEVLKARFRAGLDALPVDTAGATAIVEEATAAFARHIALFAQLDAMREDG